MRYVYAIRQPGPIPAMVGLAGAELQAVSADGLEAVCSVSAREPRPEDSDLLRHQAVLEALMAHGPVLPVRFGTRLDDEEVRARLRRHGTALSDGLDRVRGQVEMGVRILGEPPTSRPEAGDGGSAARGSGRQYLMARAAEERAERARRETAEQLAERLHARIAAHATAASLRVLPAEGTLMAGAYLVPRGATGEISEAARALAAEYPELAVVPTGPWPPFSFAPALDEEGAERVS